MKFGYLALPARRPIPSLGGAQIRHRPVIPIHFIAPTGSRLLGANLEEVDEGMDMFEWLQREITAIRTPRFHIVDGPADAKLQEEVVHSDLPLPISYREFVTKFGSAKLYRQASQDIYEIGVFARPREGRTKDGTPIYYLGFHDSASVYVKSSPFVTEPPIYEFDPGLGPGKKVADNFEEWLSTSCARARKRFGKKKWAGILRGPEPFTRKEVELIETRMQIHRQVLGKDCKPPCELEVFALPDPRPEDREFYFEFRHSSS